MLGEIGTYEYLRWKSGKKKQVLLLRRVKEKIQDDTIDGCTILKMQGW